jgi:hypothetical protein
MLMSAAFEAGLSDTDHGRACKAAFQEALKITTYRLDSDAVQAEADAMAAELVSSRLKENKQEAARTAVCGDCADVGWRAVDNYGAHVRCHCEQGRARPTTIGDHVD